MFFILLSFLIYLFNCFNHQCYNFTISSFNELYYLIKKIFINFILMDDIY